MKYLMDENGKIYESIIISEIPKGMTDISEGIEKDGDLSGVSLDLLEAELMPEIEEVQGVAEMWSNGTDSVTDINDIPMILDDDNNPIADPTYLHVPAVKYQPMVPAHYKLKKKADADTIISKAKKRKILKAAINFGMELLLDFGSENMEMGITADGMTGHVRKAMAEVTSALMTGSLKDALAEIDSITEDQKDGKYITNERLQEYKQKILDYLGA